MSPNPPPSINPFAKSYQNRSSLTLPRLRTKIVRWLEPPPKGSVLLHKVTDSQETLSLPFFFPTKSPPPSIENTVDSMSLAHDASSNHEARSTMPVFPLLHKKKVLHFSGPYFLSRTSEFLSYLLYSFIFT